MWRKIVILLMTVRFSHSGSTTQAVYNEKHIKRQRHDDDGPDFDGPDEGGPRSPFEDMGASTTPADFDDSGDGPDDEPGSPFEDMGFSVPGKEKTAPAKMGTGAAAVAGRFTIPSSKVHIKLTTPAKVSFAENCDYLAYYCLKAYDTGQLCGRTLYYTYQIFKNYCMMDYVNCMERYEVWEVAHMGDCLDIKMMTEFMVYPYDEDLFLDDYYIMEDILN